MPESTRPRCVLFSEHAVVMIALASFGCGPNDGLGTRLPVSGNVTYNGEAVPQGSLTFVPENPGGHTATGSIENGRYRLTTFTPGDGAFPGKYLVAITSREVSDTSALERKAEGGALDQVSLARVQAKARSLVPRKYALSSTSGLT